MKKYEYRHIRMSYTVLSFFSKTAFDKQLCELFQRMGNEGWEMKSSVCEGFAQRYKSQESFAQRR
jgi:hypothetical protein